MALTLSQTCFRFGTNDGTESTHGWVDAENTNVNLTPGVTYVLRIGIQESGNAQALNLAQQFQYSKNSGTWTNITTTSSVVKAVDATPITDGSASTTRLTTLTGSRDTSNANCTEDGSSGGNANDVPALGHSETVLGFQLVTADLAHGDTIDFRCTISGPTTSITYTVTPRATAYWTPKTFTGTSDLNAAF